MLSANRLLLGRSNFRSPGGPFEIDGNPAQLLEKIQKTDAVFFEFLMNFSLSENGNLSC